MSKNGYIFSFGNLQEVEDSILTHHASEVHVVYLKQTGNSDIAQRRLKYSMITRSNRIFYTK